MEVEYSCSGLTSVDYAFVLFCFGQEYKLP